MGHLPGDRGQGATSHSRRRATGTVLTRVNTGGAESETKTGSSPLSVGRPAAHSDVAGFEGFREYGIRSDSGRRRLWVADMEGHPESGWQGDRLGVVPVGPLRRSASSSKCERCDGTGQGCPRWLPFPEVSALGVQVSEASDPRQFVGRALSRKPESIVLPDGVSQRVAAAPSWVPRFWTGGAAGGGITKRSGTTISS